MKMIDSLNDGKEVVVEEDEGRERASEETATSSGNEEGTLAGDARSGGGGIGLDEENGRAISEVCVCANIGLVHLVLHSFDCGTLMALSAKGDSLWYS